MRTAFRYHGRHRVLADVTVRFTKAFELIITGTDCDSGKVRTFRVDRIEGEVKHLEDRRQVPQIPHQRGASHQGHRR